MKWDLVGGPTNGDTLGEAVISVQKYDLISNFVKHVRKMSSNQIITLFMNGDQKTEYFFNTEFKTMMNFKSFKIIQRLPSEKTRIIRNFRIFKTQKEIKPGN